MSIKMLRTIFLAVSFMGLATRPAFALLCGTVLDPLSVSATGISFGNYTATDPTATTASGTITVSCGLLGVDVLPGFTVSLSSGNGGSFAPRTLAGGGASLSYNLYTDTTHTAVWGDGSGATVARSFDGTLLHLGSYDFTVYGALAAGQFVKAGVYSDTIIVTVTY